MAWGGFLNKEGSKHIRNLREADRVIKFLEKFKENLEEQESQKISEAIKIVVNYYTKES